MIRSIKKTNSIVKQLTLLFKSIKNLFEIIFNVLILLYLIYDKFFSKLKIGELISKKIEYVFSPEPSKPIDLVEYMSKAEPIQIEYSTLTIIFMVCISIIHKLYNLHNKEKK